MTRLVVVNKTNTPRLTADGSFDKFSQKTQADAFVGGDRDVGTKDWELLVPYFYRQTNKENDLKLNENNKEYNFRARCLGDT